MDFRIKLYLYHFFLDYRKMCFIYVRNDTKTVKDLIKYISKEFKIDAEFYLTCNDFYLPHFEDIRVLKEDDVVVVVPQAPNVKQDALKEVTFEKPKKVKKKKAPEPVMNTEKIIDEEFSGQDVVTVKKKIVEEDLQMMVDELELDEVDRGKKKCSEKRSKTKTEETSSETWKNLAREYTRKRKINPLPISTSPNIVKTIIVHNGLESKKDSEVSSDSDTSVYSKNNNDTDSKIDSTTSVIDVETMKVKRKRKRIRRKRKQVHTMPLPKLESPIIPILGLPTSHIRFDDNINAVSSAVSVPEEKETEEIIELEDYKPKGDVNYEVLCKSEVVNFPLMKDRLPNPDDVVAFKRYKLSEAFTPEISNYIVGRILNFCPDSKAVFVKILEGYEECKDPEGKLFLQVDEEPTESDEKQFVWTELIEPRLLFP